MAGYIPVRLAYNKHEPDSGDTSKLAPVIFLHGLTASKEHWEDIPQTVANKTKRKVYALDARNHGDSEWSDGFNFDVNADDLLHFMDTVGEEKAILVGHSMGGVTAMKVTLKVPERIEGIIIEDMKASKISQDSLRFLPMYLGLLMKVVKQIPRDLDEDKAKEFAAELCLKIVSKELKEYLEKAQIKDKPHFMFNLKRNPDGSYANKANVETLMESVKKPDTLQSELEGQYVGPAHFIYGELSEVKVFKDIDYIRQFFPKAEFTGIEKAGHSLHIDFREEFMKALLKSLC